MAKTHTFTYKAAPDNAGGQVEIAVDVHLPDSAKAGDKLPCLVWIHGGGLFQSNKAQIPAHFLRAPDRHGIAIVSPDYRLAPQVRLPSILEDISDFANFLLDGTLNKKLVSQQAAELDLTKAGLSGASAGGFLANLLALGLCPNFSIEQASKAFRFVALEYPSSDLTTDQFTKPCRPFMGYLAEQDPDPLFREFADPQSKVSNGSDIPQSSHRNRFFMYAQQTGRYQNFIYGDNAADLIRQTTVPSTVQKSPKEHLLPVFVVHGAADSAVDVDQSRTLVNAYRTIGHTDVEYVELKDTDHLFDAFDATVELEPWWDFVTKRLTAK
ncbi:alpha/beta-hydrolase [Acaromyces ingoldii]|uniref:triacylglycerol lipase n=1 Tax=Acaromyces ingoldii TaxID=215250 RepID=A0A316YUW1_9BASI|nr:alpha/beta-hydrolase [Acaromyces ingoldii]PWN92574.1 alpha/beta-hydrolase [Acaromyces ingoldii]